MVRFWQDLLQAMSCNSCALRISRQNRGGRRPPAAQPYIKVHESEIADDYPMPSQYTAEEDEADELVLFGEEEDFGLDPENLPRRQLLDFSIYNAEVRFACSPQTCHRQHSG